MVKEFRKKGGKEDVGKVGDEVRFSHSTPSEVKEIIARGGTRGDMTQVLCHILDGRDKGKTIRRNVRGPVRVGDTLMLLDTEIEAQRLGGARKGKRRK